MYVYIYIYICMYVCMYVCLYRYITFQGYGVTIRGGLETAHLCSSDRRSRPGAGGIRHEYLYYNYYYY